MEGSYFAPITYSTSGDKRDHQNSSGKWAFEVEVGVSMAESAPFLSDTDCLNASQPTIRERAKSQDWRREGLGPEIEVGAP